MAVNRAGVGYATDYVAGVSTSGSKSCAVAVSPTGANKYGIAAFGFVGDTDISTSGAFTATWGGVAMTPLSAAPLWFDSHSGHYHSMLRGFIIENPASGNVVASFSGVVGGLITKNLFLSAAAFSSVTPLDLGSIAAAVVTAVGSGAVASSGVTVPSGVPADRVISGHQIGLFRNLTGFNGTKLASPILAGGGQMILGESRGAPSTVATVTHNATSANWAAFGLNLDALPMETLGFATSVVTVPPASFGADLYRIALPHPDRDWMVPPAGSGDVNLIAGATIRAANGVEMPVWSKDPDDTLDYTLHWNNHLAPDDKIIAVEHQTSGSLRLISEAISEEGDMTQFWVKGATRGVTHPVRIRFWTERGRQHDFTAFIAGENN